MLNTKFIKIIIIIAAILILVFTFLFIRNNNKVIDSENINSTSTLTGVNGRPILNTNIPNQDQGIGNISTSTGENVDTYTNVNLADYSKSAPEDILQKKIEKILFDWDITKDENSLRTALALSENADNEAILEAWVPFMRTNSSELIKLINTSTDIQKTKKNVNVLFQWYIELSGDYEKLSAGKKQQIKTQYNQLK